MLLCSLFPIFLYRNICCVHSFKLHRQVDAIQMGTYNICLYKVDKNDTGCNLKTMELFDCALIKVCAIIRSNTAHYLFQEIGMETDFKTNFTNIVVRLVFLMVLVLTRSHVQTTCTIEDPSIDCECPMNASSTMGKLDLIERLFQGLFSKAEQLYGEGYKLTSWNVVNRFERSGKCNGGVRRRSWSQHTTLDLNACCES